MKLVCSYPIYYFFLLFLSFYVTYNLCFFSRNSVKSYRKVITSSSLRLLKSSFDINRVRLGIDYGPRIIGIAVSNLFGIVKPYGVINNNGNLTDISLKIIDFAYKWGALEIIVGIPLDYNGIMGYNTTNFNGQLCLNFSKVLSVYASHSERRNITVKLFDERYTTKEAKIRLKFEKVKASIDAMSATCLLERYIEDIGMGAIDAVPYPYPIDPELTLFDYDIVKQYIKSLYEPNNNINNNTIINNKKTNRVETSTSLNNINNASAVIVEIDQEFENYELVKANRKKRGVLKGQRTNNKNDL